MTRSLKPFDAGYAALACGADSDGTDGPVLIFDSADWRFELGSWVSEPAAVKFDPAVCGIGPEQMGFTPGWSSIKT